MGQVTGGVSEKKVHLGARPVAAGVDTCPTLPSRPLMPDPEDKDLHDFTGHTWGIT